jgi:pimeloyl-ACP methyl ester carboxylesterase/UDP:flavonoid glycosyltransferase YjiC (YdhE family)
MQTVDRVGSEHTRARYPDSDGYVERDGVRVHYELFGSGNPTVLLLPTWSIVHSRAWKMQVPYLARHCRVLTFDGRGNGLSDRPEQPQAYAEEEFAADALAVLDATETAGAFIVCHSMGARRALLLAAHHPQRVEGAVFIAPALPLARQTPRALAANSFDEELDAYDGWAKFNRHHWLHDYDDFLAFFFHQIFTEAHSTKPIEDCVGWGRETTPETLIATQLAPSFDETTTRELAARISCPVLVIHGRDDGVRSHESGVALAELTSGRFVSLEGSGHSPHARDPVQVNLLLRDFIAPPRPVRWTRARARRKRALYISSPIGLGHARRDVAIADELRKLHPQLEIDWLAQHPVTALLEAHGERIHPASAQLANESRLIEAEADEHDLHCFQAWRRMDEILLANFMVFHDLVRDDPYDLWIGDEAWELDYYLHENPEQKSAAYAWLTDFVGWLPIPDGGEHEAALTADYNAEMLEHIARYPRLRDRALFIGEPDDIVPDSFGPGLPPIRAWTEQHYEFVGYVTGFDPTELADRRLIRAQFGLRPDERVCIVTVGGSGVGSHLLRRVIDAFPEAIRRLPDLRMIVVAGPRIDPASLPAHDGLELRAYVHDLHRLLAVCDLAVVQGGLTTTMELTTARTPFLYFPLRHHFEQTFHVRHRLERYRAGRAMDFATDGPDEIAAAITDQIGKEVEYRAVDAGGAARAAASISELL